MARARRQTAHRDPKDKRNQAKDRKDQDEQRHRRFGPPRHYRNQLRLQAGRLLRRNHGLSDLNRAYNDLVHFGDSFYWQDGSITLVLYFPYKS